MKITERQHSNIVETEFSQIIQAIKSILQFLDQVSHWTLAQQLGNSSNFEMKVRVVKRKVRYYSPTVI